MKKNILSFLAIFLLLFVSILGLFSSAEFTVPSKKRVIQAHDFGQFPISFLVSAFYSPDAEWLIAVTNECIENFGTFWGESPIICTEGKDSLWLLNIKSSEKKLIFSAKVKSFHVKWSSDSTKVFISHNPHSRSDQHIEEDRKDKSSTTGKLLCYDIVKGILEEIQGLINFHGSDFHVDPEGDKIYYVASISLPKEKKQSA